MYYGTKYTYLLATEITTDTVAIEKSSAVTKNNNNYEAATINFVGQFKRKRKSTCSTIRIPDSLRDQFDKYVKRYTYPNLIKTISTSSEKNTVFYVFLLQGAVYISLYGYPKEGTTEYQLYVIYIQKKKKQS